MRKRKFRSGVNWQGTLTAKRRQTRAGCVNICGQYGSVLFYPRFDVVTLVVVKITPFWELNFLADCRVSHPR
jgi:hypothetical protein